MKKRSFKRFKALVMVLVMIVSAFFSNGYTYVNAANKVSLKQSKFTITVGNKKTIKLKNVPKKAGISYKSSNKKVASVTKKGVVKGIKAGKAKITVTVKYKNKKKTVTKKLKCTVTVKKKTTEKTTEKQATTEKTTEKSTTETATTEKSTDTEKASDETGKTETPASTEKTSDETGKTEAPASTEKASDETEKTETPDTTEKASGETENPETSEEPTSEEPTSEETGDSGSDKEEPEEIVLDAPETIRLVINGKVNEISARDSGSDFYVAPEVIESYFDIDLEGTEEGLAPLMEVAKEKDISYEYDDILRAAYFYTSERFAGKYNADYYHAFEVGLVPYETFGDYDRIVTTTEFRDMLISMIKRVDPSKVAEFEENVTDYEDTLYNGEALGMMYYASLALGSLYYQVDGIDEAELWEDDTLFDYYDKLFPHYWEPCGDLFEERDHHFAAAIYMNCHESTYSGERPLTYDSKKKSYHMTDETTYHTIVSMTNDVYFGSENLFEADWTDIDDERVSQIDTTIYNDDLKALGETRASIRGEDLPRSTGMFLNNAPTYNEIYRMDRMTAYDVRNQSSWGFNYTEYQIDYSRFFNEDITKCNLREMQELDALVAAAVRYNLRLNLFFCFIPGKVSIYNVDTKMMDKDLKDFYYNEEYILQAEKMFRLLAARYKDVPGANLSFTPVMEISRFKENMGYTTEYTNEDTIHFMETIFDAIRVEDPDRYLVWELMHDTDNMDDITGFINVIEAALIEKGYDNYEIRGDGGELMYVYQDMNNDDYEGNNRDFNNHSMFKAAWPATFYSVNAIFSYDKPMNFTGLLPAGTSFEIYIDNALNCTFEAYADGELIHSEVVEEGKANVGSMVSGAYTFAESDKCISFSLEKAADRVTITTDAQAKQQLVISGIRITLPEVYAKEKWYFPSWYDEDTWELKQELKPTSEILICPNAFDCGSDIVITEDISYTTDTVYKKCDEDSIREYFTTYAKAAGYKSFRMESPLHTTGIMHSSAMAYYGDMFKVMNECGIGWVPLGGLMEMRNVWAREYAEAEDGVKYHTYPALDIDMLKVYQKYQNNERPE